jgi:AGZA family xanthine/uracil permease-like MFS transporter
MGTNAFFTFTICLGRGLPYEAAFAAVFVAGCIFILLSITGLRTLMIRLFPEGVKESILPMMRETHGKARFFFEVV